MSPNASNADLGALESLSITFGPGKFSFHSPFRLKNAGSPCRRTCAGVPQRRSAWGKGGDGTTGHVGMSSSSCNYVAMPESEDVVMSAVKQAMKNRTFTSYAKTVRSLSKKHAGFYVSVVRDSPCHRLLSRLCWRPLPMPGWTRCVLCIRYV